ncbi:MAG: transglutaminase domain-containing protein [bacterium]|nr:transglutaminase domain-containing protein [bacterium]
MKKLLSVVVFFLISQYLSILVSSPIHASSEFSTDYNVLYEASIDGNLRITQNVALTNKLSNIYATQYSFSLEGGQPKNISARDEQGALEVSTATEGDITKINVKFNQEVVGKDKTLKFSLSYDLPELLTHSGQIWEIALPKITGIEEIDNYNLTLKLPSSFGEQAYISPYPKSERKETGFQIFTFTKDQITESGIVAAFGQFQVFDFNLKYHLSNPTGRTVQTKIALPPETGYQKVSYWDISPRPENIEVDADGNWLGVYLLKANEKVDITASGQVKISAYPQSRLTEVLSPIKVARYTKAQPYWEIDNEEIKSLAQKYQTPKQIHDFVVQKLSYDYSRVRAGVKRLGALGVLREPDRAICMEYTDLFVAIARAAGIPARELNGFAYTDNPTLQPLSLVQDVLHAWPEYWDSKKKSWIQIDPTWQDTTGGVDYFSKLDLGHFVFAIHGDSSELPFPAGSYKEAGVLKKDVQINFGTYKEVSSPNIDIEFLLPENLLAEKTEEGKIKITNTSQTAIRNLELKIGVQNLKLLSADKEFIAILPPFASHKFDIKISAPKTFASGSGKVFVLGNDQRFVYDLVYNSLVLKKLLPVFGFLLLALTLYYMARRIINLKRQKNGQNDEIRKNIKDSSK